MRRPLLRALLCVAALALLGFSPGPLDLASRAHADGGAAPAAPAAPTTAPAPAPRDVSALLAGPLERHAVPALCAAVVRKGRVVATGVAGLRVKGAPEKATIDDLWHLGSCTKSMTATLCARLVEDGKLRFTTTLGQVFPERAAKMAKGWQDVTLEELLTHRSGAPTDLSRDGLWGRLWAHTGSPTEMRLALLDGVTAHEPEQAPGSKYVYSNAGFSMAGAMAERVTGKAWEDLIEARLFQPLGITTAGFGAPGHANAHDEPWGHRVDGTPVAPGPGADNPRAIGPAGIVHMSILDWAKYVGLHLEAGEGKPRLLSAASFATLQTPPKGFEYAMGWIRTSRPWGGGEVLTHNGSNTMWFCVTWIAPKADLAVLVCSNRGGDEAAKATDEVASALIGDALAHPDK